MSGIIGYVGPRQASQVCLEALRRLELRGCDSVGLSVWNGTEIQVAKALGRTVDLEAGLNNGRLSGSVGLGHTRWATHGQPSEANAHPHLDCRGEIAVVHNGFIENFEALKASVLESGHVLRSETDTEIIAHLLEERLATEDFETALFSVLRWLTGTYGLAVMSSVEPGKIFAARNGSPLVVGLGHGRNEFFLASDPAVFAEYTQEVIWLNDGEVAVISDSGVETFTLDRTLKNKRVESSESVFGSFSLGEHPHFMLKEIHEQPDAVRNSIRGRLDPEEGRAVLGGLSLAGERLAKIKQLTVVGCGSSYLAGLVGGRLLGDLAGIRAVVEPASELELMPVVGCVEEEALLAVSQSGETTDTLEAVRRARSRGLLTIGLVNSVGSSIGRETEVGLYAHAGPELAVAATKAFAAQLTSFVLLSLFLGRERGLISRDQGKRLAAELISLPDKIEILIRQSDRLVSLARKYAHFPGLLLVGRGMNYPIVLEGALKMKEVASVHGEGVAAGEIMHGPGGLIDSSMPVLALMTRDKHYDRMRVNVEEVRARKAPLICLVTEGDESALTLTDDLIFVPRTIEPLQPILNVIPLQLLAYHLAVLRGLNPDWPRSAGSDRSTAGPS